MPSFTVANLYGGAIAVSLPTDFADVSVPLVAAARNSSMLEVSDNQEFYLSRTGLTSIIFDIVERVEPPEHPTCVSDEEALKYHYEDIVDVGYTRQKPGSNANEDTKFWLSSSATFTELPEKPAYTMLATQHPQDASGNGTSPAAGSASRVDFTALLLTLLRLSDQKTDIVITVNVPHVPGERGYDAEQIDLGAGQFGSLIEEAIEMRDEIIRTFKILNWDLFVN